MKVIELRQRHGTEPSPRRASMGSFAFAQSLASDLFLVGPESPGSPPDTVCLEGKNETAPRASWSLWGFFRSGFEWGVRAGLLDE